MTAGARQTDEAKSFWGRFVGRERHGVFNFDRYPDLVRFVEAQVPRDARILLLGGGRGYLGHLLGGGGRCIANLDIAFVSQPFVPTARGDMEAPLPVRSSGPRRTRLCAVAAFSLEYTNVGESTRHLADVLQPGERLVWVSHHSDSYILADLALGKEMGVIAARALDAAATRAPSEWPRVAGEVGAALAGLAIPPEGARRDDATALLAALHEAGERPEQAHSSLQHLRAIARRLERESELSSLLLSRSLRSPHDLVPLVDPRFEPLSGGEVKVDGRPLSIVVTFSRRAL